MAISDIKAGRYKERYEGGMPQELDVEEMETGGIQCAATDCKLNKDGMHSGGGIVVGENAECLSYQPKAGDTSMQETAEEIEA